MFNQKKMAAQIATLHVTNKSASPESMKRFMYSILRNAIDQDSAICARGMSHTITLLMATIYDFDDFDVQNMELNDAHWEIIGRRPVEGKEIAAFCLTTLKYCDRIMDSNLPMKRDYSLGMLVSVAALAEIMSFELIGLGGLTDEN